jgi:PAS domain S-box-containing protein
MDAAFDQVLAGRRNEQHIKCCYFHPRNVKREATMATGLRLLIVEDQESDAELILHELRRAGFEPEWQLVQTEQEYLNALKQSPELIIADYTLPQFDAPHALNLLRKTDQDIPLVVVTGSIGEESAAECIKLGAADYLLKDRLTRLGEAVRRALFDRQLRIEMHNAEDELRRSQEQLERRNHELMLLNQVVIEAASTVKVEETIQTACEALARGFEFPVYAAGLVDASTASWTVPVASPSGGPYDLRAFSDQQSARYFLQHQAPFEVTGGKSNPQLASFFNHMVEPGYASLFVLPLVVRDTLMGVIVLGSLTPYEFEEGMVELAATMAAAVGQSLYNAQLYQQLEIHNSALEQTVRERTTELENIRKRVESILNNDPDPVVLLGRHATVEAANPAFYRIFHFGYDLEPAKMSISDLTLPEHVEAVRTAVHRVMVQRLTQRLEVVARCADNSTFDAQMALAPIRDKTGSIGAVCNIRDISASKEVERMKDDFVSNVSHELRTPITSLKLNLSLLVKHPEMKEVAVERLQHETARLEGIIEDLLALSRLEQGRVELNVTEFNLNDVAAEYARDREPLASSYDLALHHEPCATLPTIKADKGLLGRR